jgi:tetratricopeptide (TPR) repeat protein
VSEGSGVEPLIKAAASGDAAELEALIRNVESQPRPAAGNRSEARRINDQALSLLREKRYAEAIPVLEQARLADESDVEIVGNLADTLMRADRLDDAWRMALVGLRLAPRRTVSWSTVGMLSAKRDDLSAAVACMVTGYRFSDVQPTTQQVYSRLATTDKDAKVRAAMEEAVKRIKATQ